jgi:hypothetical protein
MLKRNPSLMALVVAVLLAIGAVVLLAEPSDSLREATVIARFWRYSSDADCDGPNWLDSGQKISRPARSMG